MNDLCLIKAEPFRRTDREDVVCLPEQGTEIKPDNEEFENKCFTAGWGDQNSDGTSYGTNLNLLIAVVPLMK
jgi:hypothetical protein